MTQERLLLRTLSGFRYDALRVVDVVANLDLNDEPPFTVFFSSQQSREGLANWLPGAARSLASIGRSHVAKLNAPPFRAPASSVENEILAGRNTIVGTRVGESASTVMEWLAYHQSNYDVTGFVLFNRNEPGSDVDFVEQLGSDLNQSNLPIVVILVESLLPLGDPNLPSEQHPYCVAEAPGRDRMEVPEPDPWQSPIAEWSIYEIARHRFLRDVRACCNIDVCDLLVDETIDKDDGKPKTSPFDSAVVIPEGFISLEGTHCYPWRVRKNAEPRFPDPYLPAFRQAQNSVSLVLCSEEYRA